MDPSFAPPYTPEFDRRQSAVRKASMTGEKIPEEEYGEMHAGEDKYHQVRLVFFRLNAYAHIISISSSAGNA